MKCFNYPGVISLFTYLLFLFGCSEKDDTYSKNMPNYGCNVTEIVARSIKSDCNIQFWDIMHNYTYVSIESSFYTIGAPCNQSAFAIKYINLKHDHNEPDYTFILKMDRIDKQDFFKPGSIKITELAIFENKLTGGGGGPVSNVDISLIWDEVLLLGNVYSGKGRFVINKGIPSSFPNYTYPVQEIPFEFKPRERTAH